MSYTFKIGDVVTLKSGGHEMTVCSTFKSPSEVGCHWSRPDLKRLQIGAFSPSELILATDARIRDAAPDLLDALVKARNFIARQTPFATDALERIDAAIAKAKGA